MCIVVCSTDPSNRHTHFYRLKTSASLGALVVPIQWRLPNLEKRCANKGAEGITQDTDENARRDLIMPAFGCGHGRGGGSSQNSGVAGCQQLRNGQSKLATDDEEYREVKKELD